MATVCVPFFLLIGSLNTTSGMEFWRSKWHQLLYWLFGRNRAPKIKRVGSSHTNLGTVPLPDPMPDHLGSPHSDTPLIHQQEA